MPWFCHTECGCNLDVDADFLKALRESTAKPSYIQVGPSWYRLTAEDAERRFKVDLGYGQDGRWKQVGAPSITTRRFTIAGMACYL